MFTLCAFLGGVAVGVIYEKTIRAQTARIEKAANAAKTAYRN